MLCAECMEFLALLRGAPLTRIACANCQQAKQDQPGKARSGQGSQLRAALRALNRGDVVAMPDPVLAVSTEFTCADCGKTFETKAALGFHGQVHPTQREWDQPIEEKQ
jgi:LSD1 subclass zinc finger protein